GCAASARRRREGRAARLHRAAQVRSDRHRGVRQGRLRPVSAHPRLPAARLSGQPHAARGDRSPRHRDRRRPRRVRRPAAAQPRHQQGRDPPHRWRQPGRTAVAGARRPPGHHRERQGVHGADRRRRRRPCLSRLRPARAAALRVPRLPDEPRAPEAPRRGQRWQELRGERRRGAPGQPPRRARSIGEDPLRGSAGDLRRPVQVLAAAWRDPHRPRRVAGGTRAEEVPMRFAEATWLWGMVLALVVALALTWGGWSHQRAVRRFGDPVLVTGLKTAKTGTRRAVRAVLLVLALCLVFVAAAQPQYGRGTRLIPATNLDVVIVLDFSKSMYARDVTPSRSARAKVEVSQLIRELGGARFGGVAFAGTPMSFPLTSDGAAVAQFFRGLEPTDMPVGGTAIARALDAARQLLERDPKSKKHERVAVLVTDGEDLEGDPVALAEAMARDRITVHVVQIGGRSPEPIPEVDEHGQVRGLRQDSSGQLLTTALTAEGEAQLAQIAAKGGGKLVRAEKGTTGVEEVARELRRMMTEELSEQVETIYADVYAYPLGLALVLILLETLIGTAPYRKPAPPPAPPPRRTRRRKRASALTST